jgi:hypothetical protein
VAGLRVIAVTLLVILVVHPLFLIPPDIRGLPDDPDAREFLLNLWQVTAAVLGIGFVILIFVIETIHRTAQGEYVWQRFAQSLRLYVITAFILGTILAVGGAALALSPSPEGGLPRPPGLANLVILDSGLFTVTLVLVLWLYADVFRLLSPAFVERLAMESLLSTVQTAVSRTLLARFDDHLLHQECETLGLLFHRGASDWPGMRAVTVNGEGAVTDISLSELRKLARLLPSSADPKGVVALGIRSVVSGDGTAAVLVPSGAPTEEVAATVRRCFRVSRGRPERARDLGEAFDFVTEQALRAIEAGRLEQFRRALDALQEPIRVSLETLRSYGLRMDAEAARNIFSFEWPAFERPFREYERIVEAAARSSDANIVAQAAGWPYRVMSLAVHEGDHYFYREAVNRLPYLYRVGTAFASERAKELLRDRAWRHLKEFGSSLAFRFQSVSESAALAGLRAYVSDLHAAYVNLLRLAIDGTDREYLREAAFGFWQAFDINFAGSRTQVGEYLLDSPQMIDLLTRDRDRAQAEALIHIADFRSAVWVALGGWVCHRLAKGRLPADFAAESFRLVTKRFGDFRRLWRGFNSALWVEWADRLPLSDWLLSEQPEGQVVSLNPEGAVSLFFTLVALTNIPEGIEQRVETLARPRQASWAKTLVDSALREIRGNPTLWQPLIGGAIEPQREGTLTALLAAAENEERRREQLHIMEQPLSPPKLAEFKAEFLASWVSNGLLRRLLDEAGAVDYTDERRPGLRIAGLWTMVPKGAFVEETGSTVWMGVGHQFGSAMAAAEDDAIYEALNKRARRYKLGGRSVAAKLSEVMDRLARDRFPPDVILFSGEYGSLRRLERSAHYVPFYNIPGEHPPFFQGTFRGIPVYTHRREGLAEFLVLSLHHVGRGVQYLGEDESMFRMFEIKGFTNEEAAGIVAGDRSWLPQDARGLAEDTLIEYLREHVSVRIEEAFEMRIDNPAAARGITLSDAQRLSSP